MPLACISHHTRAVADRWDALSGLRPVGPLERVSTVPARPATVRAHHTAASKRPTASRAEASGPAAALPPWVRLLTLIAATWLVPWAQTHGSPRPDDHRPLRPVHTYSIVARDPDSGEMGVAVQSHWFAVGSRVAWAEAGVGVVATQSFIEVRYGASGLDLMRSGWTAPQALAALLEADPHPEVRQVAMIDARGEVAVHTGAQCIRYAGDLTGEGFAVQANLMLRPGVEAAMAQAYRETTGALAERLLVALEAAQAAGGDLRGRQAASLVVVRARSTGRPWEDRIVDLHVEDHPTPVKELRRLYRLQTAYEHMDRGDRAIESGDVAGALSEYGAAEALAPENLEMRFWHAVSLVNARRLDEALPLFAGVFARDLHWRTLVGRLHEAGLLSGDAAVVRRIESVQPLRPHPPLQDSSHP